MITMNGTQLRTVFGGAGAFWSAVQRGANAWRRSLQTLLVDDMCSGALGLLSGRMLLDPGSPRLGSADTGLYSAAPLGLVCGGAVGAGWSQPSKDVGTLFHRGDNVWRSLMQTLLVAAGCGGVLGLLSCRFYRYPGSPRLGSADPGLYSAAPLGLVWLEVEGETGRTSHFQNHV